MAQIILGAQGIGVETDSMDEEDRPVCRESVFNTGLDISRKMVSCSWGEGLLIILDLS